MIIPIERQTENFANRWVHTPSQFPAFKNEYSASVKQEREALTSSYYARFKEMQETLKKSDREVASVKIQKGIKSLLQKVYDFPDHYSNLVTNGDFFQVSRQFLNQAKAFDEQLSNEEIYQALRNVWIMNGIQNLMNLPVELTPSIFAYSLLYPYSDNYLDDPSLSRIDKLIFSLRFEQRLKGEPVVMSDPREDKISQLVGMIESQFSRHEYPDVYESLLAIHHAQTGSLNLQCVEIVNDEKDILCLSFAKGGTSVLADGYLVAGELTSAQQHFLFGYGVWLQLLDDVQDIKEDLQEGVNTLFTFQGSQTDITGAVNRTFHFGRELIHEIDCFPSDRTIDFGGLMLHAVEQMLNQAAGMNPERISPDYAAELERFSPLSYNYIREMKKKGSSSRMSLVTRMIREEV
ncbi:MAG TPA: hypothetical protein DCY35_09750 [Prolixibacteraceae bacterium]|nr:hypothetical protein [Prolixibacteraceae bacterium]